MAYPGAGLDSLLDEQLALGQVVGHAGRRGQLTDCLCSHPTALTVNANVLGKRKKLKEARNERELRR